MRYEIVIYDALKEAIIRGDAEKVEASWLKQVGLEEYPQRK